MPSLRGSQAVWLPHGKLAATPADTQFPRAAIGRSRTLNHAVLCRGSTAGIAVGSGKVMAQANLASCFRKTNRIGNDKKLSTVP